MGQVRHGCATTTHAARAAIQRSQASLATLSRELGINPKTVAKWRKRATVEDLKTGPKAPHSTTLTEAEEAMVVAFRRHTLLPLDDCLYALQPSIPHLTRSALHRCLQRHGISRLPDVEGDKPKRQRFKRYPIGFFHMDIAEVQTAEGKLYLFVGIDRTSKFAVTQLVDKADRRTAWEFLEHLLKAVAEAIDAAIARGGSYAHQYRVCRADGHYYWVEGNGRLNRGVDGSPLSFPGVLIDVEERRSVEAERDRAVADLRALNETLEQRVAQRTADLGQAEDALRQSQKVEAIGQLTGGVAHDFNNLLTVIRGSVDLLRRPGLSDERRQRYIDAIADTADRATKLTNQLLAFARRQSLKPEVFDVTESVRTISDMVRTLTGARIITSLRLPSEPCYIDADRSQFDTALVNLAVNARDAMKSEGELKITVEATSEMPAIRTHPAVRGEFITVALTDSGPGIPVENIDRIFEPFFTTKGVGEGTGLGLSQVFGFTKQSGGDVIVTSDEGQGATFTMYLPRVEDGAGSAAEAGNHSLPLGDGACVLVVEDNAEVGMFATEALAELGYKTVWAMDGKKALAELVAEDGRFDVVFSDVMMPGMSGIELGQEIARLYPGLPVVLTSGYSEV